MDQFMFYGNQAILFCYGGSVIYLALCGFGVVIKYAWIYLTGS